MQRRSGHRRCLKFAMGGENLLHRSERSASKFARNRVSSAEVWIDYPQQPDRLSLQLKFFVNARVVAPENAYTNYRDGDRIVDWQERFSLAGCRWKL